MALITSRISVVRGRPPGFPGGMSGSRITHSSSLMSLGYSRRLMADLLTSSSSLLGFHSPLWILPRSGSIHRFFRPIWLLKPLHTASENLTVEVYTGAERATRVVWDSRGAATEL